jgi:general transcription factor IIIA
MTTPRMTYTKNERGEFVCPHCGETKARQNTMFYHMRKHTGEMPYVCSVCSKGFIQKSGLQQHLIQAHPKEAPSPEWHCPCCDHASKMKANLMIHIARKHCEEWIPAQGEAGCSKCKKTFSSGTAYYYHAIHCFDPTPDMLEKLSMLAPTA